VTIKLDENLPERVVAELSALGHDVDTVRAERLASHDDTDVWRGAQTAGAFSSRKIWTSRTCVGTHRGRTRALLLVRLAQPGRDALLAQVAMLFSTEPVLEWRGCLVVATDHKVRVKRAA